MKYLFKIIVLLSLAIIYSCNKINETKPKGKFDFLHGLYNGMIVYPRGTKMTPYKDSIIIADTAIEFHKLVAGSKKITGTIFQYSKESYSINLDSPYVMNKFKLAGDSVLKFNFDRKYQYTDTAYRNDTIILDVDTIFIPSDTTCHDTLIVYNGEAELHKIRD